MGGLSKIGRRRERQERVLREMATRREFEEFWGTYCEERGWKGLPGPYDCGSVGRGYERVVSGASDQVVGEERADMGGEMMRTEGLVTRGLAKKREAESEGDGSRRRRREASEASSEESDIRPPSKRRRKACSGKVGSSQSSPSNEES